MNQECTAGCSKRSPSKASASEETRRTLRYVESLSDARTKLADVFSILLEHPFDGTTGGRIQFSRDSSGLVRQPACKHRVFHRLGHGNGIFSSGNGRVHEYRVRP